MSPVTSSPAIIRAITVGNHRFQLSENSLGKPVAHLMKLISAGPSKGHYKRIEGFYFDNEAKREIWIKNKIKGLQEYQNRIHEAKNAKKEARANMKHGFEVGQVLYNSWGYDQTNVDFYKIIEVNEKSIKMIEIGGQNVPGSEGMMCCRVRPNPAVEIGEPILKIIQARMSNGQPSYYVKSQHGRIGVYDKGEKGTYCSFYA